MAITKSGLYFLTIEKVWIDTLGESIEGAQEGSLVSDTYAPNFDTHDFHADLTNELTTPPHADTAARTITVSSNVLTYDQGDFVYSSVTVSNAMAHVGYTNVGASGTDQLHWLSDFVTAASATAADFTVQFSGTGIYTQSFAP